MAALAQTRTAVRRWLDAAAFVTARGDVLAWLNPARPGHAYPEAAGLFLRWLGERGAGASELAERVSSRLWAQLDQDEIGREGHRYPFDEAVVIAGLTAVTPAARTDPRLTAAMLRVATRVRQGLAVLPPREDRWSTRVGPHFFKLAIAADLALPSEHGSDLLEAVCALAWEPDSTGRIETPPHPQTYVHAHLYAAEGLLALSDMSSVAVSRREVALHAAQRAATWVDRIQTPEGGIHAWHDGSVGSGALRCDATAQAVRLWALVDREAFKPAIDRALGFLASAASATGGIPYEPASGDVNTWCTLFVDQAFAFVDGELTVASQLL